MRRRPWGSVVGLAALALALPAAARPAASAETRLVRTSTGRVALTIDRFDEARSNALRTLPAPRSGKPGPDPQALSLVLRADVVVQLNDPAALPRLLTSDAARHAAVRRARPLDGVPGTWVLSAGSVRGAADLADRLVLDPAVRDAFVDAQRPHVLRNVPDDPRFPFEWHLRNDALPIADVNAEPAWDAGYTGAGVVIGIVEDAWQHDHPDLAGHFNAAASQTGGTVTSHATNCAGVAAAIGNNGLFGAGMAFDAQLSNQIYGSDADDAAALGFANDINDVKSNSWGPMDNGMIHALPSIVEDALREGVESGRGGLGEVFVWAAGNGFANNDRVDYDPYASSRYTIAVGAIGDADVAANYSEPGSSLLVVAHSSGNQRTIYSTDLNSGETFDFGGTSSACPLVAGLVAVLLEQRPDLSWRDVQSVLVHSARQCDPDSGGWTSNAAGLAVHERYGFGAVDAGAAVALAQDWQVVGHEIAADTGVLPVNLAIPDNDATGVTQTVQIDRNLRLEHAELILNVASTYVGDLEVVMTSPGGTASVFAQRRFDAQNGFVNYRFTSVRCWDEAAAGLWTVRIADRAAADLATWQDFRIVLYGTPGCPGDLDEDGQIDLLDLSELLVRFGACQGEAGFAPEADLDNSRCLDIGDLMRLLDAFGAACP